MPIFHSNSTLLEYVYRQQTSSHRTVNGPINIIVTLDPRILFCNNNSILIPVKKSNFDYFLEVDVTEGTGSFSSSQTVYVLMRGEG